MRPFLLIITIAIFFGCGKEECDITLNLPSIPNQSVYDDNISTIEQYLLENDLTAESTASGLHYIIEEEGSDEKPELCDEVRIAYTGYLVNGNVFDMSPDITYPILGFIYGWREGIPLFGKSGRGTLLIPSYLAYGDVSPGPGIPANSVLIFDIELIDF